ncbi:MAG: hypothetical protein ACE3JP_13300 [Ectobacillus sp.]
MKKWVIAAFLYLLLVIGGFSVWERLNGDDAPKNGGHAAVFEENVSESL